MGRDGVVGQSDRICLIVGIWFIWIIFESQQYLRLFLWRCTALKTTSIDSHAEAIGLVIRTSLSINTSLNCLGTFFFSLP